MAQTGASPKRQAVYTQAAPRVGFSEGIPAPIAQAVRWGDTLYVSGMGPLDPVTKQIPTDEIEGQIRAVLENIRPILEAAGTSFPNVVKVNCYLQDIKDFPVWNKVFVEYFPEDPPARTTVQALAPRPGVRVEIEVVAGIPE